VITLTDEVNRQQKIYSDVVGRQLKTEILNTDLTVYSTATNTFNARDQVTLVRQYQGADTSTVYQDTTMSYDGYGRLLTKHVPEQQVDPNNSSSTDHTTYVYNSDDTVYSVTDARGAVSIYGYNGRRQVTSATHTLSGQATISMSYGYDAVGNRITMTDGLGSQSYSYNQLSQMTSETRTFSGLNSYTMSYGYNLAGESKSVTDPSNSTINYAHDAIGRVSNVTGTNYSITQFLSNVSYRASGATKEVSYGNGRTLSLSYNQRLEVTHFEIPSSGSLPSVMAIDYQYNDDGRLSYSHDLLDSRFDRGYQYDHEGRIKLGLSGADANGSTPTTDRPYRELYGYDAFDHLTVRNTRHWSKTQAYISTDSFTDNRRSGWQYDAEGNLTDNLARQYTYDAAGRMSTVSGSNLNQFFDGDGQRVKTTEPNLVTYYLRSSVLGGQVIEELDSSGSKQRGFVYVGGKIIAEQVQNGSVGFVHEEPSGTTVRKTDGELGGAYESSELDPFRQDTELEDP
jgi:YD repeat-containing protein